MSLFTKNHKVEVANIEDMNVFEQEQYKAAHTVYSANGSLQYDTTGNEFLDDFASISRFRAPRDYNAICETMERLWSIDALKCLKNAVYMRLITRDTKLSDGTVLKAQRGQGVKYEYIHRLLWLANNHFDTFKKNMNVFVSCGSYNDLFELLRENLILGGGIDKCNKDLQSYVITYILGSLSNPNVCELVKKYLPTIKTKKDCKTLRNEANTIIGKAIAKRLNPHCDKQYQYKSYRWLKSSGTAHDWQKQISRQKYDKINFDTINGRALTLIANSKFLENHGLVDSFVKWIDSKDTVKFKGYPYELMASLKNPNRITRITADKQFITLVNDGIANCDRSTRFITCVDSSSSMSGKVNGTNVSSLDVAQSMALYFSYFNEGEFAGTFLEFNDTVTIKSFGNGTPSQKIANAHWSGYCGSTNFCKVANLFVALKKNGYAEESFPNGVVCVSDGEFNDAGSSTTFDKFLSILRDGGFSTEFVDNFKLVLWDIPNRFYGHTIGEKAKFESLGNRPNFYYMSGFDASGIAFLTGIVGEDGKVTATPKTAEELYEVAMSQEILKMLTV